MIREDVLHSAPTGPTGLLPPLLSPYPISDVRMLLGHFLIESPRF